MIAMLPIRNTVPRGVLPCIPVLPGERVVTRDGDVATVAFVHDGVAYGLGPFDRAPRAITPVTDAFGGEHDMTFGLRLAA